jgi:hypothetical protein
MEHFAPLPDEAGSGNLPEPVRLRVMEELDGDASALLEHFRERGMSEGAAAREVEAWLGTPPEMWRELEEIHRPIAVRWADRLLEPRRHRVERGVLLLAAMLLVSAALPVRADLVVRAAFGTGWLVLGMACVVVVLALRWSVQRWLQAAVDVRPHGMLLLAGLGAPALGLLGAGVTLSRVKDGGLEPWPAVELACGLATVALMVGIAGGVLWSIQKAAHRIRSPADIGGA